jgi:tetratricopeptide (TPR) repeat protein
MRNVLLWKGDIGAARLIFAEAERSGKEGNTMMVLASMRWRIEMTAGNYETAEKLVAALRGNDVGDELFESQFQFATVSLLLGECEALRGNAVKARQLFDSARIAIEGKLKASPTDERIYSALGIALAGLGRNADAVKAGQRGVDLLPVEKDAWRGSSRLTDLARIYVMTGDQEKAVDVLEHLLSIPAEISRTSLKMEPWWNPLRGNKRFQKLLSGA